MPKEYSHWHVADGLEKKLPAAWKSVVSRHRSVYLLGAIAPDIPYYYRRGPQRELFRSTAERLHGGAGAPGEAAADTVAPVREFARQSPLGISEAAAAFLCGYLSHVAADAVFHPMVLHFAGRDKTDHHAIETVLDLHFLEEASPARKGLRIADLLHNLEIPHSEILTLLCRTCFAGRGGLRGEMASALRQYRALQRRFWSPAGRWLIRRAARHRPERRPEIASYYLPEFHGLRAAFARAVAYRHPVTGTEHKETAQTLCRRAVDTAAGYCRVLLRHHGEPSWLEDLASLAGIDLYTGLPASAGGELAHLAAGGAASLFGDGYRRLRF